MPRWGEAFEQEWDGGDLVGLGLARLLAETLCSGPRSWLRLWVRREVLPSMATSSGAVEAGDGSRSPSTQAVKHRANTALSVASMTNRVSIVAGELERPQIKLGVARFCKVRDVAGASAVKEILHSPCGHRRQPDYRCHDLLIVELTQGCLLTRSTMQYRGTDLEPTQCPNQRRLPLVTSSSDSLIFR